MFAPLARFLGRRPEPAETEHAFVADLRVLSPREPRSRRSERILALGWVLVIAKCIGLYWAIHAYAVPVHPASLILPTLAFAALCTVLYIRRD